MVDDIIDQIKTDLIRGEAIALPLSLLIMLIVFGGFLAAGMPLVGALSSIGAGLFAIFALTYFMDVDSSVVNVASVLGLGLSIDYALLIVSRCREELRRVQAKIEDDDAHPGYRRGRDPVVREARSEERRVGEAGRRWRGAG